VSNRIVTCILYVIQGLFVSSSVSYFYVLRYIHPPKCILTGKEMEKGVLDFCMLIGEMNCTKHIQKEFWYNNIREVCSDQT
jgi:hypothetical protein